MAHAREGLRIVFAGTPQFAAHHLEALIDSNHHIAGVYTQPDRPAGRGKKLSPSPVKQLAEAHGLAVFQPLHVKSAQEQQILAELNADVMVVVAYGLLLPEAILATPRYGCLNVHASLLPRWRGAAPIQRAIEAGDNHTGVTIMQMDKGLDTGAMLLKAECPITLEDTSASLHDKLMTLGAPALLEALTQLARGELTPEIQDDQQACYAEKITKEEALIDWQLPAEIIARRVRAFNPFPIAYTECHKERVKIHYAQVIAKQGEAGVIQRIDNDGLVVGCGEQSLSITQLQLPGKKAMQVSDLLNGYPDRFSLGETLG